MPTYDYPFNERVRSLLRVEDLLQRIIANIRSNKEHDHFLALQSLLQLVDVIDRADMKFDLLQELEKQRAFLQALKEKQVVTANKINELVDEINKMTIALQKDKSKLGHHLRTNEWLMNIKQRYALPGGICKYDTPSFQHWLSMPPAQRRVNLSTWLRPLIPMQQSVYLLLQLLRGGGKSQQKIAKKGTFHQLMGGTKPSQMLRVTMPDGLPYYPEVSANKYAINIRFHALDHAYSQQKANEDISFELTLCNL